MMPKILEEKTKCHFNEEMECLHLASENEMRDALEDEEAEEITPRPYYPSDLICTNCLLSRILSRMPRKKPKEKVIRVQPKPWRRL